MAKALMYRCVSSECENHNSPEKAEFTYVATYHKDITINAFGEEVSNGNLKGSDDDGPVACARCGSFATAVRRRGVH